MKDFLGNPITVGSFVVVGGKGNVRAEYGMILHRVYKVTGDKAGTERLEVKYPKQKPVVTLRKTTISNPNAAVVITPTPEAVDLFEKAEAGTLTDADSALIGHWVHGASHVRPWN